MKVTFPLPCLLFLASSAQALVFQTVQTSPRMNKISQAKKLKHTLDTNVKSSSLMILEATRDGLEKDTSSVPILSSVIGIAGTAMGLLSPLFSLEAKIQAGVLVGITELLGDPLRVYPDEIRQDVKKTISAKKPVLYTYGLSPFSTEAKALLKDYDVDVIELGAEWFLLGPEASEQRLALAENSPNQQTSLPHLFVKGESLGGLSTGGRNNSGIFGLLKSGDLDKVLKKKPVGRK